MAATVAEAIDELEAESGAISTELATSGFSSTFEARVAKTPDGWVPTIALVADPADPSLALLLRIAHERRGLAVVVLGPATGAGRTGDRHHGRRRPGLPTRTGAHATRHHLRPDRRGCANHRPRRLPLGRGGDRPAGTTRGASNRTSLGLSRADPAGTSKKGTTRGRSPGSRIARDRRWQGAHRPPQVEGTRRLPRPPPPGFRRGPAQSRPLARAASQPGRLQPDRQQGARLAGPFWRRKPPPAPRRRRALPSRPSGGRRL